MAGKRNSGVLGVVIGHFVVALLAIAAAWPVRVAGDSAYRSSHVGGVSRLNS
jgi:hypothetical protein